MAIAGLAGVAPNAQAAIPNVWGFAYVDTNAGIPSPSHQAGSWGAGFNVTTSPGGVGQVYVRFPQLGLARGLGVVHVTASAPSAYWCQAQKWGSSGADIIVVVQCYRYGGAPIDAHFSVMYESSSGVAPAPTAFGYVHWDPSIGIVTQHNSTAAVNTVVPSSPGIWTVRLPGLGSATQAGNVQVTSVDPNRPARCKVGRWLSTPAEQVVVVVCHDATTNRFDTGWTLTYQRERAVTGVVPRAFAYTFDNNPANPGPYAPAPAAINYNSQLSVNTVQTAGLGLRLVIFPRVGYLPNHVQVTAFGGGPEFCNLLTLWTTSGGIAYVRDVACYSGGTRVDQPSLVSYVSAR